MQVASTSPRPLLMVVCGVCVVPLFLIAAVCLFRAFFLYGTSAFLLAILALTVASADTRRR